MNCKICNYKSKLINQVQFIDTNKGLICFKCFNKGGKNG